MRRKIYIAMIVFSYLSMALAGIWYTDYVSNKSDNRWCELVIFYDDYYSAHPERITTSEQARLAEIMHKRRSTLHCDN